ncbi:hypothetical protein DSO57_1024944 [Entomophthora muscae]|uniref:Uncharacterized protein n=1 Tax=Entomophthora muscae TaxID=34485 RepID=A0ACC2UP42_9FUNG|nr:hypothetical protein DSO57_1024944 [Entomophthora muscae]
MSLTAGFLDTSGKIFLSISTFVVVVGLGSCAVFIGWLKRKQNPESDNLEFFLTARSTQPALRVAWSFVAGGLGAWILTSPPSIAEDAGILGVVAYSVFAGLPIFLIAMVGARIQKALPKVLSFSDYIYHRFGIAPQFYVTLIVLLNLGVAMTAEYTAISAIFEACLGQDTYPIAIGLSIVTSAYTACGGLLQLRFVLHSDLFLKTLPLLPKAIICFLSCQSPLLARLFSAKRHGNVFGLLSLPKP